MKLCISFNEVDFCSSINFIQTECTFNTDFGEVILVETNDVYDGDYNVIPRVYQQTLETRDKVMIDNVTIEIIPLAKTKNLSNGYTVTIG